MNPKSFLVSLLLLIFLPDLPAANEANELTPELANRYELMLVRSPQPGSAFDRVVEWYSTKGGGLEILQKRWQEAATHDSNKQAYLLIQGLLAERLRTPDAARKLYQEAIGAGDPSPAARLLAALETSEGKFPEAAKAYEQALASESLAPVDRMELMRAQALLYQRAFDDDKALSVWREAIKRFPNDPYVLEEAGEAFLAANHYADARDAFTKLQEQSARDPYRKIAASLRLGRTSEMEEKNDEAVRIYEQALGETSEGSWINREVRQRIEDLFRRRDDLPGLLAYYEKRTGAAPQDYQSFADMADVLKDLRRTDESINALRKATQLAPGDGKLRTTLIRQLIDLGRTKEALAEAEELAKPANADAEAIVMLGTLQWHEAAVSKKEEDRLTALKTWRRIAPEDSTDVSRISQLADLFSSHELTDEAVMEWRRVIALEPGAIDSRQQIAAVEIKRGNGEAAQKLLAELVSGNQGTAENFLKLAKIQERMKWPDEAHKTLQQGREKFPKDYDLLNLAWQQTLETKNQTEIDSLFPIIWANAPNEFFADEVIKRYVNQLETSGKVDDLVRTLTTKASDNPSEDLYSMVLFRLAISQKDEKTAKQALELLKGETNALRSARAVADFAQTFGTPPEQVAALRAVAIADPRLAADSLRSIAKIQASANNVNDALKTLNELIERSPADASLYTLYADLAARSGKFDEAVSRLRESIRYVEDATSLRLQLAGYLQALGQTDSAMQTLQEAFEKEPKNARRMDIFRRQIELAQQTGKLEDLIATFRERQSKEQGGARYGVYLAEIFLLQNDFLAAKEELMRSLGKNPDNPTAVARLIDLAERGGDQPESLRLSARLAELEPSVENRSAYIQKLLSSGDTEAANTAIQAAWKEIRQDPSAWNSVILAMPKAGFQEQSDRLINEIADTANDPAARSSVAWMRLSQGNYAAAENEWWKVVEGGGLKDSLEAVAGSQAPSNSPFGTSLFWARSQPLQQLVQESENSIRSNLQAGGRGHSRSSAIFRPIGTSLNGTTAQRDQVRAIFILASLARAAGNEEAYQSRVRKSMEREGADLDLQLSLFSLLNDGKSVFQLIKTQANDPNADAKIDKLILEMSGNPGNPAYQNIKDSLDIIRTRMEKSDPSTAYQQLFRTNAEAFSKLARNRGSLTEEDKKAARKIIDELLNHPARKETFAYDSQLASYAARLGDIDLTIQLIEQSEKQMETMGAGTLPPQVREAQSTYLRANLVSIAIRNDDPRAQALFEDWLKRLAVVSPTTRNRAMPFISMGGGQPSSPLLNQEKRLVVGDSELPLATFQIITGGLEQGMRMSMGEAPETRLKPLISWFTKRAKEGQLDPYQVGLYYLDWFSGKPKEAIKRLEAVQTANPSPRVDALLLEAYEKSNAPDKALAVIDRAELQTTETQEVREIRRLRLLREADRKDEARQVAEKLAKGRLSLNARNLLANEFGQLGIPATTQRNSNMGVSRPSRPSQSRDEALRNQVNKLVQEQKNDEAERIALLEIDKPIPGLQDSRTGNLRRNLLSILRLMGRMEPLESKLLDRLEKDPGDFDAALRLIEARSGEDTQIAMERLAAVIEKHPERVTSIEPLLMLMQQSSDSRDKLVKILCLLLTANPSLFTVGEFNFNQLISSANESKNGARLAETVAKMGDADYQELFFRDRLMGQMDDSNYLSQLAEILVQEGKPEGAIKLFQRALGDSGRNPDAGLGIAIRLAELQLAQGQKAAAAETLKTVMTAKPQSYSPFRHQGSLQSALLGQIMNQSVQPDGPPFLEKLARIAEDTGTLDLLLAQVEKPDQFNAMLPPGLVIRTYLKKPGVAKDWAALVAKKDGGLPNIQLPMVATMLKLLATQPNPKPLMLSLLKNLEFPGYGGGDTSLNYLRAVMPLLTPYRSEPTVEKHVEMIVDLSMKDPNAANYFAQSSSFVGCLTALLDADFAKQAQRLYDLTAVARLSRNSGNQEAFPLIEARLKLARGEAVETQIICAGFPGADESLNLFWTTNLRLENRNPNSNNRVTWDNSNLDVPPAQRPVNLEIWAGSNPVTLQKIAEVPKPKATGSVKAKAPVPLGLLQARWKLRDGSTQSGPLTVYVTGKNQIVNQGVPEPTTAAPPLGTFTSDLPGPLGPKSAISFEASASQSTLTIPLGKFSADQESSVIVLTGWVRSAKGNNSPPRLGMELTTENGRTNREELGSNPLYGEQWAQLVRVWAKGNNRSGIYSMPENLKEIGINFRLNASSGYNQRYFMGGSWAGMQYVGIRSDRLSQNPSDLLTQARQAFQKKDYPGAVEHFLAAIKSEPKAALESDSNRLVEAFEKANALDQLFAILTLPALYLPNPLRDNQPTFRNEPLVSQLIREAIKPGAPEAAQKWLKELRVSSLPESLQFLIDASMLREGIQRDPNPFRAESALKILGWDTANKPNSERVKNLWQSSDKNAPIWTVLEIFDTPEKRAEALAHLKSHEVPPETLASQRMLEAWLNVTDAPEKSADLWRQTLALRTFGPNQVSISDSVDRNLLTKFTATNLSPGDLLASYRNWLSQRGNDPNSLALTLNEFLYQAQSQPIPRQAEYESLWMDSEMAALKSGQPNDSRERITGVAERLYDREDWDRLAVLMELTETIPALKNSPALATFAQMRSRINFARGNLEAAWPIAWCAPGTQSQKVTAHWQWNLRFLNVTEGIFDSTISIADRAIRKTIPGQTAVEFWFGEMPSEMKLLQRVEGDSATGSAELALPTANGFLRVIAVLKDKRVPGPMIPVLSGKRVFPTDDLKSLLLSGAEPLAANQLSEGGTAPDGTPAVRIGVANTKDSLKYAGPEIRVQAGKFYVLRNWIHRAGNGGYSDCVEYRAVKGSKAGSLSMILSDRPDLTDQWVLMTRAVPTLPQHTFWIPFNETDRFVPRFWDAAQGTQIAWELLEIENWKYGQWLTELAMLRQNAAESVADADIERAIILSANEPLTALDYHGSWLADQATRAGKTDKLIPLYQTALTAEANPLFSRPKLNRVLGSLSSLIDNPGCPKEVRWELVKLAAANSTGMRAPQLIGFKRRQLDLAKINGQEAEVRKALLMELRQTLADPKRGSQFLTEIIQNRAYRSDRPVNDFALLCAMFKDPTLNDQVLQTLSGKEMTGIESSKRKFVELMLNVTASGVPPDAEWNQKVTRALAATERLTNGSDFLFWPAVLGDVLLALDAPAPAVLELRQQTFNRATKLESNPPEDLKETLRTGEYLLEACVQSQNPELATKTAQTLLERLDKFNGKLTDDSLGMIRRSMDSLVKLGDTASADTLFAKVRAQAEARPKVWDIYSKYLPTPKPSPSPSPVP